MAVAPISDQVVHHLLSSLRLGVGFILRSFHKLLKSLFLGIFGRLEVGQASGCLNRRAELTRVSINWRDVPVYIVLHIDTARLF